MSRIRSIKPEFWTSEQVMECSTNARLLFIGLWNFCDDHGRHPFAPRQIKALIFPGDSFTADDVRRMLDELSTNGLIITYVVDGKEYFHVSGWKHQKIDRPQPARFPPPFDESSSNGRRTLSTDNDQGSGIRDQGRDQGEEKIEANDLTLPEPSLARKPKREKQHSDGMKAQAERFYSVYPKHVDPRDAEKRFCALVAGGEDPERIIGAAERYAEAQRQAGTEKRFIPAPAVWLNKGGYLSEDLPERRAPQPRAGPHERGGLARMFMREMEAEDVNEVEKDNDNKGILLLSVNGGSV